MIYARAKTKIDGETFISSWFGPYENAGVAKIAVLACYPEFDVEYLPATRFMKFDGAGNDITVTGTACNPDFSEFEGEGKK